MEKTILSVNNLNVTFGKKKILKNINLEINKNEITVIIGQSGCGKSTLLKSFNRIVEEEGGKIEGNIMIEGEDFNNIPLQSLRNKIGLVFQNPVVFPFSIEKNLTYALEYHNKYDEETIGKRKIELLKQTKLYDEVKDHLHMFAGKLSGGQKQRLSIARCLSVSPKIILLDEPCSALDVKNTMFIEEMLMELKKEYTIVIVTHNLAQAKRIGDNVIFMDDGKIVEEGRSKEFFECPKENLSKEYIKYMGN
ncbi:phosphate ABC transporter ATP-binding protein [Terrisporobacter sp.]